jgi:hypothetical protein
LQTETALIYFVEWQLEVLHKSEEPANTGSKLGGTLQKYPKLGPSFAKTGDEMNHA